MKFNVRTVILSGTALIIILLIVILVNPSAYERVSRYLPAGLRARVPMKVPDMTPSAGREWSQAMYPNQYDRANYASIELSPTKDLLEQELRLLDAGGRAYSKEFISRFNYGGTATEKPHVLLEYIREAETFTGKLTARGLKPNAAYQMKLRGVYDDSTSFENIGRLGRWRLPGRTTNYTDSDYESFQDKHLVESYLFFDFFLTDGRGNAYKEFYADSSLHVLWNLAQRPPTPEDSALVELSYANTDPRLYSNPGLLFPGDSLSSSDKELVPVPAEYVYAESEHNSVSYGNRPPIRQAFLPEGTYSAEFVLTEESFHSYGDGGYWATVMAAPVEFRILDRPKAPAGPWQSYTLVTKCPLKDVELTNIETETQTDTLLTGKALTEDPTIVLSEEFSFLAGERYILIMEIFVTTNHMVEVFADTGDGFSPANRRIVRSTGCTGWRLFEMEITGLVGGKNARLRIDPTASSGTMRVRNVAIGKL